MKTITYPAIIFRQRDAAPVQVAFAAPSYEIDQWARVPTKRTGNVRNFQRAEIPTHINEVQRYFEDSNNSSPTAVVVGFDRLRAAERVQLMKSDGTVLAESEVIAGVPQVGTISINWEDVEAPPSRTDLLQSISELRGRVRALLMSELVDITGISVDVLGQVAAWLEASPNDSASPEDEDSFDAAQDDMIDEDVLIEEDADPAVMPEAISALLAGLTPSEVQIILGRLRFLKSTMSTELEDVPIETLRDVYGELKGELKPGILIDGQHRVSGSKRLGKIPFLVCALPNASWPELAFQFIVTNRTARRVQESLLISIVGNSLSKKQREQIEERLRNANIRVGLIEAVMKVHEDESSPFYGMLSFGLKNETGFLDAAAVRTKVVKMWYERKGPLVYLLDHVTEGRTAKDRTDYWKGEDLWFSYLIDFWSAVRERYEGSGVFSSELADVKKKEPASKLMTATVLGVFQHTVLEYMKDFYQQKEQMDEVPVSTVMSSAKDFRESVLNALKGLTPEFFVGWKLSGFDGSRGAREDLELAITAVLKGKTVAQVKSKRAGYRLFTETDTER